mmetsp:Transcript_43012/g.69075  ORF Transcript_43012/g.69075 Transcript_43012/m.69075 type:complete len:289 (-) Transcript_43012:1532-2398(-)
MQAKGKYNPPPGATDVLGLECSGEVVKLGPEVTKWKVGDKVMSLLNGGSYAEYVTADERLAMPLHGSFEQGAAIPETWLTAFQLLHLVAKVNPQDSVLIHAGASGVGIAAIQLLKRLNVNKIIVTAGSQEKIDFCKSLGAHTGFNYKTNADWAQSVLDATDGKGTTVILDCVGYPYVENNAKAAAPDCRWVLFGLMGGPPENGTMPAILRPLLMKRIQLLSSTLRARSYDYKHDLITQFTEHVGQAFDNNQLRPVLDCKNFTGLDQIHEAHAYMESNQSKGKIILSVL